MNIHVIVSNYCDPQQPEWTKLVCTPAPGSLFVIPAVGMSTHVERNNYVPLFGVDPIECRLTLLRNT